MSAPRPGTPSDERAGARTGPGTGDADGGGRALIEEAAKKSSLVWVRGTGGRTRPLWHVWHEDAVYLVGDGPGEQPFDGLGLTDGASVTVTARSKDKGGRLVAWPALVALLPPHGEVWERAVEELRGRRLNAPDAGDLTARWARECQVLRLVPAGPPVERPGAMPDVSHAAVPVPTSVTTRRPAPASLLRLLFRGSAGRGRNGRA